MELPGIEQFSFCRSCICQAIQLLLLTMILVLKYDYSILCGSLFKPIKWLSYIHACLITKPANSLAPNSARPSANTVLSTILRYVCPGLSVCDLVGVNKTKDYVIWCEPEHKHSHCLHKFTWPLSCPVTCPSLFYHHSMSCLYNPNDDKFYASLKNNGECGPAVMHE